MSSSGSGLAADIEVFRKMIARLVEQLNEVSGTSKTIPSTSVEQLDKKFAVLSEKLQSADRQLSKTNAKLEEIRNRWGR